MRPGMAQYPEREPEQPHLRVVPPPPEPVDQRPSRVLAWIVPAVALALFGAVVGIAALAVLR